MDTLDGKLELLATWLVASDAKNLGAYVNQARSELAALRQHIEELEREQPELIAIAIMQGQQRSADEIKRLREALERIADRRGVCAVCGSDAEGPGAGAVGCDSRSCEWSPQDPRAIARAALGRKA